MREEDKKVQCRVIRVSIRCHCRLLSSSLLLDPVVEPFEDLVLDFLVAVFLDENVPHVVWQPEALVLGLRAEEEGLGALGVGHGVVLRVEDQERGHDALELRGDRLGRAQVLCRQPDARVALARERVAIPEQPQLLAAVRLGERALVVRRGASAYGPQQTPQVPQVRRQRRVEEAQRRRGRDDRRRHEIQRRPGLRRGLGVGVGVGAALGSPGGIASSMARSAASAASLSSSPSSPSKVISRGVGGASLPAEDEATMGAHGTRRESSVEMGRR